MPLKGVCSPDPPSENSAARGGSHLQAAVCPPASTGKPFRVSAVPRRLLQGHPLGSRLPPAAAGPLGRAPPLDLGEPTLGPCGAEAMCLHHLPSTRSSESLCHQLPTKSDL